MANVLRPQAGPQEMFLSTSADIAFYGGAAGGGKTYSLLLEMLRNVGNPDFNAVIFRRNSSQVFNEGGLWDNAIQMYTPLGVEGVKTPYPTIRFPSGAKIRFSHLQYDKDVHSWQGGQICLLAFDEICHFSSAQFFYMLSRNRSTCGVKPYCRATCNPDADSWVAQFIQWYWDAETGYPIPERSGVIRYFVRVGENLIWGDSKVEILRSHPEVQREWIKSFTFIASKLTDNKILMQQDPGYLGNLMAQSEVERERLLNGNWKIRPAAGKYFKRDDFTIVDVVPDRVEAWVRSWDLAATQVSDAEPSPDATAGVLMGRMTDGRYIVADVKHVRKLANDVRKLVLNTATLDRVRYKIVKVTVPQDPGQAGKEQANSYVKMLAGYTVETIRPSGSKENRANPFASQVQAGNVLLLKGDWNDEYIGELESFPDGSHDDMVDASSDAFNKLSETRSWRGLIS